MVRKQDERSSSRLNSLLRRMFRTLQERPTPDRILSVVDQLDEGKAGPGRKKRPG